MIPHYQLTGVNVRSLARPLCFLLLALFFVVPLHAAEDRGDLVVTVYQADGEATVEGAVVRVFNRARSKVLMEGITGADGTVRLSGLALGEVFVEARKDGVGLDRSLLSIDGGSDTVFDAYLMAEDEDTTAIQVQGDLLLINATDPNQGATTRRDQEFLRRQIASGGDLQGVLTTVPGLQQNSLGQVHARGEHKALSLSLDGVDLPLATTSQVTQPLDPEFIETADVSTGMYDAAVGGQTGAVINATTLGDSEKPFVSFEAKAGDFGQTDLILKAGGSNDDNSVSYFVGARRSTSDLYLAPPTPDRQDLNNNGELTSLLARLTFQNERNRFGFNVSHQSSRFGLPQTPQNFAAGVIQNQNDANTLLLTSWNHDLTDQDELLFGLAFQKNRLQVNNNGVFTSFNPVAASLNEELAADGFPADPENPGSPYLPTTNLAITQLKPSLDYTHRFSENHRLKAGFAATFIDSDQELLITDPGGGGGLPNPLGLPGVPVAFSTNLERRALSGGVYLSHTYPLREDLVLNYGLRAETFDNGLNVQTGQLSPRLNLAWSPTEKQSIRASYNRIFQPPPIEIDVSGGAEVLPQRTHAYELSYENQFAKGWVGKASLVYKDFRDQVDIALLIPNSSLAVFAPVNFARAEYKGLELGVTSSNPTGWNGFLAATLSEAKPTEAGLFAGELPEFNDHDQRFQATAGVSHTWQNGLSGGLDVLYGSGFPQDALPLYNSIGIFPYGLSGDRQSRFITNLNIQYRPTEQEGGTLGAGLQVFNLFDDRSLLNFFSEFSGTRFVQGRRFLLNLNARF